MKSREEIIERFNAYNFHDDTIHAIKIFPATSRKNLSKVEIESSEYYTNKRRFLTLKGCANISLQADFDVLLNNAPPNVEYVQAYGSGITIKEFVERQRDIWNVEYEPPIEEPIKEKIQNVGQYVLFRILDVVAKDFAVKGATKRDAQTAKGLDQGQDGSLPGDNRQRSAAEWAVMFGSGADVDGGVADDAG
jgi:hypothetical protein